MTRARHLLASTAAIALAAGALVSVSTGEAAAAPCLGRSCAFQDPAGCTAASSITKHYVSGSKEATVVNEYSTLCNANWVFAYENTAAQNAGWQLALDIWTTDSSPAREEMCVPDPVKETDTGTQDLIEICRGAYGGATGWPTWTDMVDGTHMTYGTMTVFDASGARLVDVSDPQ